MGVFLPSEALPGLRKYKYAGEDHSLLSRYILKPTYTRLVELLPKSLAPNTVTVLGLLFSLDSFLRALYYGLQNTEVPSYVYCLYAVELLLYQTLDALDGQQARRTGSSSPLGELFDHCVDAINTSLQVYVSATVFQFSMPQLMLAEFTCTLNFFLSTWEEYHTHKLFLSVFSGPVEGIFVLAGLQTLTAYFGPQIWSQVFCGFTFQDWMVLGSSVGLIFNIVSALANVKRSVNLEDTLPGLLPFVVMWAGFATWFGLASESISALFVLYFLALSFTFALLVGRIITAHVTAQKYPMWTPILVLPAFGIVGHFFLDSLQEPLLIAVLCGTAFGVYAMFVCEIIVEITSFLGINCFSIKHRKKE